MQSLFDAWYTKYDFLKTRLRNQFGKIPTIGHIEAHSESSQLVEIGECDTPEFVNLYYKDKERLQRLPQFITAFTGFNRYGHNFVTADKDFYFDHVKFCHLTEEDEFTKWLRLPCPEMPMPLSHAIVILPPYDRATGHNVLLHEKTGISFDIDGTINQSFAIITRLDCGGIAINCCYEDDNIDKEYFVSHFYSITRNQSICDLLNFLTKQPKILLPLLTALKIIYMLMKPDAMKENELTEPLRDLKRRIIRSAPKIGKFGIRPTPKFCYFILQDIKPSKSSDEKSVESGSGREMKPHQRKGFFRMQWCGPGRKELKEVFVRDTIIHRDRFKGDGEAIVTRREV